MFKGRVEKVSHEGGLLVSYSGACPALGSVMIDSNETYVGKVDGVIGNLQDSLVHVAHLDRKTNPGDLIGVEIVIRTRKPRQDRDQRPRRNDRRDGDNRNRDDNRRRDNRGRDDRRSRDRFGNRDDRRGRNDSRGRDDRKRGTHSNNDWECPKCNNLNYSFRTECNRCGEPKGRGGGRPQRKWEGNDRRAGDRKEAPAPRPGDWECPQCGKSNFAKRNECFGCGRSKRVGGPRRKGHHRKSKDPQPLHSARYGRGERRND